MNRREAANVARHARVNGLDGLTPEHILGAFAVLEQMDEQLRKIRKQNRDTRNRYAAAVNDRDRYEKSRNFHLEKLFEVETRATALLDEMKATLTRVTALPGIWRAAAERACPVAAANIRLHASELEGALRSEL